MRRPAAGSADGDREAKNASPLRKFSWCSSSPKQGCDGDVLIDLGPVNAMSTPDQPPLPSLLGASV
jgi:hypothetical protein